MKQWIALLATLALLAATGYAAENRDKVLERIKAAGTVLNEIQAAPDKGIPEEIMASADCVAVVPSMLKGGFVVGANYGRGVATCRHGDSWSAPAPIRIEGGSLGLQIGGQAVDLIMLVMNQKGMDQLLQSKFKVGADVSAAAGPVGRHVEGTTDWKLRAQVLTYSRARGAFAGISLDGAVLKQDEDDTRLLYARMIPFDTILSGSTPAPGGTEAFLAEVSRYFHASKGKSASTGSSSAAQPSTGGTSGAASKVTGGENSQPPATGAVGSSVQTESSAGQTNTASKQRSATGPVDQPAASSAPSSADVQRNIQKALRDAPGLSAADVVVNVTDSSVELNGAVPNDSDKETIRRLAQQNAGTRKVVDNVVVK